MDSLKELAIDKWYRALTYLSTAVLVAVAAIPNAPDLRKSLLLASLGGILIGIGQWIDHPYQTQVDRWMRYKIHGYIYSPSLWGWLLQIAGFVLLGRAIWLLW